MRKFPVVDVDSRTATTGAPRRVKSTFTFQTMGPYEAPNPSPSSRLPTQPRDFRKQRFDASHRFATDKRHRRSLCGKFARLNNSTFGVSPRGLICFTIRTGVRIFRCGRQWPERIDGNNRSRDLTGISVQVYRQFEFGQSQVGLEHFPLTLRDSAGGSPTYERAGARARTMEHCAARSFTGGSINTTSD